MSKKRHPYHRTILSILCAAILAATCFAGCGSIYSTVNSAVESAGAADSAGETGEMSGQNYASEDAAYASESDDSTDSTSSADSSVSTTSLDAAEADGTVDTKKLVYRADIDLQTLEYDKTITSIHKDIEKYKGFTENETESNTNYYWYDTDSGTSDDRYASFTIRVPRDSYQDFVNSLDEYGKVIRKSMNTENVTKQYSDTEKQKEALEKEENRLLEMMDKAESVEDMISVESRLTEVETQLSQIKTDLSGMDTDIAYSTINLNVEEVKKYTESKEEQTFGERIKEAFGNSWKGFVEFLKAFVIGIIYCIPAIVVICVIIFIVRMIVKKKKDKKKRQKREEKAEEKGEAKS